MTAEVFAGICLGAAAVGIALGLGSFLYYRRQLRVFSDVLNTFEKTGELVEKESRETMESKLISRLCRVLKRSRQKEEQAGKEKQEIAELLSDISHAENERRSKMFMKETISDISHQLKTPLANILLNTELLKEGKLSSRDQRQFLMRNQEQAEKMQWLMKTLVKASRIEQGILVFDTFLAPLTETLARSISAVYALAKEKQISIETEKVEECMPVHNPKWTAEAIGNILENAVKYSPKGSRIFIETTMMELYVQVKITDEGPGICEAEYNRIFRRFYRGKQAEEQEGSGLGLYLAQVILQSEKGYITVAKGRRGGTCFSVFLFLG